MGERKISFDVLLVTLCRQGTLTQATHAFRVFAPIQVSFTLFPTKNASATCHLKSFGDAFSCFSFSSNSCHSGPTLRRNRQNATEIAGLFRQQAPDPLDSRKFPILTTGRKTGLLLLIIWFTAGARPVTVTLQL
jgi:hypothetical protein